MPLREQAAGQISSISWNEPPIHPWAKMTLSSSFSRKNCVLSHFEAARGRIDVNNYSHVSGKSGFSQNPTLPSHSPFSVIHWNHKAAGSEQRKWKWFLPTLVRLNSGRVCPGQWGANITQAHICPSLMVPVWGDFFTLFLQEQYQLAMISSSSYTSKSRKKPTNFMNKTSPNFQSSWLISRWWFFLSSHTRVRARLEGRDNTAWISSHQW